MKVAGQPSNKKELLEIQYIARILTVKDRIRFIVERQKRLEKMIIKNLKKWEI